MDDIVLVEIIQRNQNLNRKPFDQVQREALEVVHLDELIQVHRQHFKTQDQMLAE